MVLFLVKLSCCWALFAMFYGLFLRHETFFNANRHYLLFTLLAGPFLSWWPVSDVTSTLTVPTVAALQLPVVTIGAEGIVSVTQHIPGIQWLWLLYWAGVALSGLRLGYGLYKINRLIAGGTHHRLESGGILVESTGVNMPFSFFYWIFIPKDSNAVTWPSLLAHERAHVKAWHSADILLVELFGVLCWFHPLVYWYRRSMREVHEYHADAIAAAHSDKRQYGLLLIEQAQSGQQLALVNHFFQSPLKQRIIMLTKTSSAPFRALKFTLVIPLLLFVFCLLRQHPLSAQTDSKDAPAEFKGGLEALSSYLAKEIQYPETAKNAHAAGTALVAFTIKQDGSIHDVEAVESPTPIHADLMAEAIRVVKAMPSWKPAVKAGKMVKSRMTLPIQFKLDAGDALELLNIDTPPQFPGGEAQLMAFLANNIQYPPTAKQNKIEGLVVVHFIVEKDGSLSTFTQLKSPSEDLYQETIRVLSLAPRFTPAMKEGQPVRVKYTLPVMFKL